MIFTKAPRNIDNGRSASFWRGKQKKVPDMLCRKAFKIPDFILALSPFLGYTIEDE